MSTSNKLRIACIGFGNMGWQHFCALNRHPDWEVDAICDLDPERLKKPAEAAPQARQTDDFQSILDDGAVDAVSINTLSNIRPTLVLRALEAGKHMQAEKPIAETPDKAFELAEKVRAFPDLICVTNLFSRNASTHRDALRRLHAGEIGALTVIRISHCTAGPDLPGRENYSVTQIAGGHTLHDCGIHYVDLVRWFANGEIAEFDTRAFGFWEQEYDKHFMTHGVCENGVGFEINNSFCYTTLADSQRNHSFVELIGSQGVITIRHDFNNSYTEINTPEETLRRTQPYGGKNLKTLYAEFAAAIRGEDMPSLPRFEDAARASLTAQAMVDQALARGVPSRSPARELKEAIASGQRHYIPHAHGDERPDGRAVRPVIEEDLRKETH